MKSPIPQSLHRCFQGAAVALLLSGHLCLADELQLSDAFDDSISVVTDRPYPETNAPREAVSHAAGSVEIFRERYADGKVKTEREVTIDADGNYVNHGAWKMWDPTGLLIAEGQYELGRRVGNWTRMLDRNNVALLKQAPFNRFKAPFISQVSFSNDKMNGEWTIIDLEQRKCSQISLEEGVRHGLATTWMPNGKVLRQTRYDRGVPVGEVLQTNQSTGETERVATFLDGRRVAKNSSKQGRSGQLRTEEMYLAPKTVQTSPDRFWNAELAQYGSEGESLLHGMSKAWYPNGQLQWEGEFRYDKRVGQFQFWHQNGQLASEGSYLEGEYEGQWLWWHENGQKAIAGEYRDGKLVGEWRWWNELGKLANRKYYDGTESVSTQDADEATDSLGQSVPSQELIR